MLSGVVLNHWFNEAVSPTEVSVSTDLNRHEVRDQFATRRSVRRRRDPLISLVLSCHRGGLVLVLTLLQSGLGGKKRGLIVLRQAK